MVSVVGLVEVNKVGVAVTVGLVAVSVVGLVDVNLVAVEFDVGLVVDVVLPDGLVCVDEIDAAIL